MNSIECRRVSSAGRKNRSKAHHESVVLPKIVSLHHTDTPLDQVDLPTPEPGPREIRIRVSTCGVCHTELDEIEGRTVPPQPPIIPGHEVVGWVDEVGRQVTKWRSGRRGLDSSFQWRAERERFA